ncbi:MAG: acyltransferase [Candidatus Eisenbacteria sp.]|nr:acyltransferase [Candidatus Eisenbacteria bacterium]
MIRIAAIQTDPRFGDAARNLAEAAGLIRSAPADLYVLPELFATGYLFRDRDEVAELAEEFPTGVTCRFLADLSAERRAVIAGGFPERTRDGGLYNSGALFDRGRPVACYRKIHLFDNEWDWFDAGDLSPRVHPSSSGRLGPLICFDWIYPETARCLALAGAQILVHMVNLVMPYCQDAMVTRCLENRLFAVTANRIGGDRRGGREITFTGQSQITAPDGQRLARASADRAEVIVAEVDVAEADNKQINPRNDLLRGRRPGLYGQLTE